jgi:hypothetical protein
MDRDNIGRLAPDGFGIRFGTADSGTCNASRDWLDSSILPTAAFAAGLFPRIRGRAVCLSDGSPSPKAPYNGRAATPAASVSLESIQHGFSRSGTH